MFGVVFSFVSSSVSLVVEPLIALTGACRRVKKMEPAKAKREEPWMYGTEALPAKVELWVKTFIEQVMKMDPTQVSLRQGDVKFSNGVISRGSLKHYSFAVIVFDRTLAAEMQKTILAKESANKSSFANPEVEQVFPLVRELAYLNYDKYNESSVCIRQESSMLGLQGYGVTAAAVAYLAYQFLLPVTNPIGWGAAHITACIVSSFLRNRSAEMKKKNFEILCLNFLEERCPSVALSWAQKLAQRHLIYSTVRGGVEDDCKKLQKLFPDSPWSSLATSIMFWVLENKLIDYSGNNLQEDSGLLLFERITILNKIAEKYKRQSAVSRPHSTRHGHHISASPLNAKS